MVQLLARGYALCLLLDWRGDPAAVRAFIDESCRRLEETQPPSQLQHALWLWRSIVEETMALRSEEKTDAMVSVEEGESGTSSSSGGNADLAALLRRGTPLVNAVSSITVQGVVERLKKAPLLQKQKRCNGVTSVQGNTSGDSSCDRSNGGDMQCETVEALWVLTHLAALVDRAVAVQVQQLLGRSTLAATSLSFDMQLDNGHDTDDLFRHECAVLVPVGLCRRISGLSLREVIKLCCPPDGGCSHSTSLIINPSVLPGNNPHRREKNKRLDSIQHMLLSQCYESMVRTCGGGTDGTQSTGSSSWQQKGQQQQQQQAESFASFLSDASIGFDMQIMALSGGAVGYYLAHVRGYSTNVCIVCGAIGLITMLLVDAALLMLRMGKVDAQTWKKKKKRKQQLNPKDVARQEKDDSDIARCDDIVALRAKKNA